MPRPLKTATYSIQVFSDDTNLDAYQGQGVWTRDPQLGYQEWQLDLVSETPEGTGIYTIKTTVPQYEGKCLEATAQGGEVVLRDYNPDKLSQLWVVDLGQEQTAIESRKFRALVLTANGVDTAVTLKEKQGESPAQTWSFYNKG
ncbi:ricin-type beta-trefoil lectin domain protein [Streptomyces sp. NPDC059002]|uniref:ricin-type beta-trefoil lectin domain protein n=1 Tax=Streptomyces sp. NPDC059002 TaxID=3346690 RepID=UPI0036B36A84